MKPSTLIAHPRQWTRHYLARDKEGFPCMPDDKHAYAWCVKGALAARGVLPHDGLFERASLHCVATRGLCLFHYNDAPATTHEDVLALLREVGL